VTFVSRLLLLAGATALALATVLPWVTIRGIALQLGPIGAEVAPAARTVNGTDTVLWPFLLGAGVVVAVLALAGIARKLLLTLGLVVIATGGALLYYLSNVVDIETSNSSAIEKLIVDAVISSSVGPGAPVIVAAGIAIVAGALLAP
jgi:hypothetical protein